MRMLFSWGGVNPGKRNYCTAYSEFTVEKVLSSFHDEGEDGDGKELFENMKAKLSEFRHNAQALAMLIVARKLLAQVLLLIQLARSSPRFRDWILARFVL